MAVNKNNRVKMIGPKGKISYVSLKASRSVHLSNLGFMVAHDQGPTVEEFAPHEPPTDEDQRRTGPLGFKSSSHAGKA
jgi:hypothetical protein